MALDETGRTAVIHNYRGLDLKVLKTVILSGRDDLLTLGDRARAFLDRPAP